MEMELREYGLIGEKLYYIKLPNGLSVFVIPKRGFHKYNAYFAADYGGADRRFKLSGNWIDSPEGVAHFLEHKMFDTEDGDVLEKLSLNGASVNAYTSTDITAYHFDCSEKFTGNLETLLSFVSIPFFTAESVEKEKGIITQEIRMCEDDPDYCLYYGLLKSLFFSNPIRDSVAGTIESISQISSQTLYDCHSAFYAPSNMALCVAGDVDPQQVADIAQKLLPDNSAEIPERDYGPRESFLPVEPKFSKAMEVSLPLLLAGCKVSPAARGRDSMRQELVSSLALDILAGHSSPLYFSLYDEGLVSGDFSASFDSSAGAAYAMFGGETRKPDRVFDEVIRELERLSACGPDPKLFDRIKKAAIGGNIRSLNSFDTICGSMAGGFFRGYDTFETAQVLAGITVEDIASFLRESLNPGNMSVSTITPK